jgi:hypothetical protein
MPKLEIDFNCMCLFVPDPHRGNDRGTVYVLMPATSHCSGHERHIVRMLFKDKAGKEQMREMEGWELVLGAAAGTARTTLDPADGNPEGDIVDLTKLTSRNGSAGYRVPKNLIEGNGRVVASRVVLNAGEVVKVDAQQEAKWAFGTETHVMAHRVTWQVELPSLELTWNNLLDSSREGAPLASLDEVAGNGVFKLHVHHVTEAAYLRKAGSTGILRDMSTDDFDPRVLNDNEIGEHFRMFYALLGDKNPDETLLPRLPQKKPGDADVNGPDGGGGGWACKTAQASL